MLKHLYHTLCVLVVVWNTQTKVDAFVEPAPGTFKLNDDAGRPITAEDVLSQLSDAHAGELRDYYLNFDRPATAMAKGAPPLNASHAHWMRDLVRERGSAFANRTLREIVLPGTHDSGAYDLSMEIIPGYDDTLELIEEIAARLGLSVGSIVRAWGIAQFLTIYEQLEFGIRYLDLRPAFHPQRQEWLVGHGTYGTTMSDIFAQIESFLRSHPEEVVVIELAHLMGHTQSDARDLVLECQKFLEEFMLPAKYGLDLTLEEMVDLDKRLVVSFFNREVVSEFPLMHSEDLIYNNYANTKEPDVLFAWAPQRALHYTTNDFPEQMYKISWTLTPDEGSFIGIILPSNPRSLHDLSKRANPALPNWADMLARDNLTPGNLVNLDFCEDTEVMRLVREANERLELSS